MTLYLRSVRLVYCFSSGWILIKIFSEWDLIELFSSINYVKSYQQTVELFTLIHIWQTPILVQILCVVWSKRLYSMTDPAELMWLTDIWNFHQFAEFDLRVCGVSASLHHHFDICLEFNYFSRTGLYKMWLFMSSKVFLQFISLV